MPSTTEAEQVMSRFQRYSEALPILWLAQYFSTKKDIQNAHVIGTKDLLISVDPLGYIELAGKIPGMTMFLTQETEFEFLRLSFLTGTLEMALGRVEGDPRVEYQLLLDLSLGWVLDRDLSRLNGRRTLTIGHSEVVNSNVSRQKPEEESWVNKALSRYLYNLEGKFKRGFPNPRIIDPIPPGGDYHNDTCYPSGFSRTDRNVPLD
jgi:hypothetical protein